MPSPTAALQPEADMYEMTGSLRLCTGWWFLRVLLPPCFWTKAPTVNAAHLTRIQTSDDSRIIFSLFRLLSQRKHGTLSYQSLKFLLSGPVLITQVYPSYFGLFALMTITKTALCSHKVTCRPSPAYAPPTRFHLLISDFIPLASS